MEHEPFIHLLWLIPVALILRYAWVRHVSEPDTPPAPDEITLLAQARTTTGATLAELSQNGPVLAVFLRHSGCTLPSKPWLICGRGGRRSKPPAPRSHWYT